MQHLITDWATHSQAARHIRELVFIQEQQVPIAEEWDGKDEDALHFLTLDHQGSPIACARLLIEDDLLHIGRVAVLKPWRQQGVGHELMKFVLHWCAREYPGKQIYLHAQTTRITFYERLGFNTTGDVFLDAGIPHIEMWLT